MGCGDGSSTGRCVIHFPGAAVDMSLLAMWGQREVQNRQWKSFASMGTGSGHGTGSQDMSPTAEAYFLHIKSTAEGVGI